MRLGTRTMFHAGFIPQCQLSYSAWDVCAVSCALDIRFITNATARNVLLISCVTRKTRVPKKRIFLPKGNNITDRVLSVSRL